MFHTTLRREVGADSVGACGVYDSHLDETMNNSMRTRLYFDSLITGRGTHIQVTCATTTCMVRCAV